MAEKFDYTRIKQNIDDRESEIVLEKDVYDQDTGTPKTVERRIDPRIIDKRIDVLNSELTKLKEIKRRIGNKEFDTVNDKRKATK